MQINSSDILQYYQKHASTTHTNLLKPSTYFDLNVPFSVDVVKISSSFYQSNATTGLIKLKSDDFIPSESSLGILSAEEIFNSSSIIKLKRPTHFNSRVQFDLVKAADNSSYDWEGSLLINLEFFRLK